MDIRYTLRFFSEWHCGSGLAAGADLDALVVKDRDGLPYVPGRTLKGLVREAVENVLFFHAGADLASEEARLFVETFGNADDPDWNRMPSDADSADLARKGSAFFSNAEFSEAIRAALLREGLVSYLYNGRASTAINAEGVAKAHSLRRVETAVPCELAGTILGVPEAFADTLKRGLRFIKCLGLDRNRGLGRCEFIVEEDRI